MYSQQRGVFLGARAGLEVFRDLIRLSRWEALEEAPKIEQNTTFEWVNWCKEERLHQSLGYRVPAEVEDALWEHDESREIMENKANA